MSEPGSAARLERVQIHCFGYFIVKLGDFHRRVRTQKSKVL